MRTKNNAQSGFAPFIIVLLIAIVGIGTLGYFARKNGQPKVPVGENKSAKDSSPSTTITPTVHFTTSLSPTNIFDETVNWKSYTNSELGFSFKYPAEWSYRLGETHSTTGHVSFDTSLSNETKNTDFIFEVTSESESNNQEWINYSTTRYLGSQTLGNNNFGKYITSDLYDSLNLVLKKNGKIIRFAVYPYNAEGLPNRLRTIVEQILSTFEVES